MQCRPYFRLSVLTKMSVIKDHIERAKNEQMIYKGKDVNYHNQEVGGNFLPEYHSSLNINGAHLEQRHVSRC